jgi:hypothetical protein
VGSSELSSLDEAVTALVADNVSGSWLVVGCSVFASDALVRSAAVDGETGDVSVEELSGAELLKPTAVEPGRLVVTGASDSESAIEGTMVAAPPVPLVLPDVVSVGALLLLEHENKTDESEATTKVTRTNMSSDFHN